MSFQQIKDQIQMNDAVNRMQHLLAKNQPLSDSHKSSLVNNLDISSIGKKLGKIEASTKNLEDKLNYEANERKILERENQQIKNEFRNEVKLLKSGFDSYSETFTEGIEKAKNLILDDVQFKITSLTQMVLKALKKIESDSKLSIDKSDSITLDKSGELLKRIEKIEEFLNENNNILQPGNVDINTGLVKISFCEKKLEDGMKSINEKIDLMNKEIKELKKDIETLKYFKEISTQNFEHLQRDFIGTSTNINKFNYQTQMILKEAMDKMKMFDETMRNQIQEFNKIKTEFNSEISQIKMNYSSGINKLSTNINNTLNKFNDDQENFKQHILTQNNKFIDFIQVKFGDFSQSIKKGYETNQSDINTLQLKGTEIEAKVNKMQKDFFNNLNEVEEFMNKKYESIYRIINIKQ